MPDIDPAAAYRTLTQRASAMRAEAEAARKQSVAEAKEDAQRLGLRRDELDRERGALMRDAEVADAQVKKFEEQRQTMVESADDFEADVRSGKYDGSMGTLWKRNAEEGRGAAEQLAERAAAARADAAATRERLAGVDRQLVELDNEVRVAGDENQAARMAIFALSDQAQYVEEAARRYGEAAAAGDDIPERAAKELAAEQALQQAGATAVDRDAIRRVIPTFPDQTPGVADHPWPPATPVIGPEETLDPFAGDSAAAAGGEAAITTSDQVSFTDPFDRSGDEGSTGGTEQADATAGGSDDAWLEREAAQVAAGGQAAVEPSGLDTDGVGAESFVAGSDDSPDHAVDTGVVASATETVGYDDDASAADFSAGYGDAATADSGAGYADAATTDATAAYDDYAATTDAGGYDDYASTADTADSDYDSPLA